MHSYDAMRNAKPLIATPKAPSARVIRSESRNGSEVQIRQVGDVYDVGISKAGQAWRTIVRCRTIGVAERRFEEAVER